MQFARANPQSGKNKIENGSIQYSKYFAARFTFWQVAGATSEATIRCTDLHQSN
jgi:hypothetical protein